MYTYFISDLHLSPEFPEITRCFTDFILSEATDADAIYILGDLFEFWVGDDDNSHFNRSIKSALHSLTQKGVPCYFVRGNRDFLVGKRFAKETGVTLLDDVTCIDLYEQKAIVLHGDTLCTDDKKYQEFRKKVHMPWLQWLYNRLPLFAKKKVVSKVQSDIRIDKKVKSMEIMDVNQDAVENTLRQHNTNLMIHGHTHRPNIHQWSSLNTPYTRIVLGDWYNQGSVLKFSKYSYELISIDFH